MDIFPFWKLNCFKKNKFKYLNQHCFTGLFDFWKFGEVLDEELCPAQLSDIYNIYGYDQLAYNMSLYQAETSKFETLENPGVQTNIIYSSMFKTFVRLYADYNPLSRTLKNKMYATDGLHYDLGDGMVLSTSAIAPGVKWAYEYDQQTLINKINALRTSVKNTKRVLNNKTTAKPI